MMRYDLSGSVYYSGRFDIGWGGGGRGVERGLCASVCHGGARGWWGGGEAPGCVWLW